MLITVLVLGILASLSPSTIIVFILLLSTNRARVNASAFLVGWSLSVVVVFGIAFAAGGTHFLSTGDGRTSVQILEIVAGIALIGLGARQWRVRHRVRHKPDFTTRLEERLNHLSPLEATGIGVLKQPWSLTAAAAVIVVRHQATFAQALVAMLLFIIASTATVSLLFLYYARRPGEAQARLTELRNWLAKAGPTLAAVVSLLVGAYLVLNGTIALATG